MPANSQCSINHPGKPANNQCSTNLPGKTQLIKNLNPPHRSAGRTSRDLSVQILDTRENCNCSNPYCYHPGKPQLIKSTSNQTSTCLDSFLYNGKYGNRRSHYKLFYHRMIYAIENYLNLTYEVVLRMWF